MKIVINRCWGGYSISQNAVKDLGAKHQYSYGCSGGVAKDKDRLAPELIALIEEKGSEYVSGPCAELKIVEIPDTATDWLIHEYDGMETVLYVVDGLMYELPL